MSSLATKVSTFSSNLQLKQEPLIAKAELNISKYRFESLEYASGV